MKITTDKKYYAELQKKISEPTYEFHIAKLIRKKYEIEDALFSTTGNVIFTNNTAVRNFTHKLNKKRSEENKLRSSELYAIGLLHEIYHYIIKQYVTTKNKVVFEKAYKLLNEKLGEESNYDLLKDFNNTFPPMIVYKGRASVDEYLATKTKEKPNTEISIEELLLLYFSNVNPACKNLKELFDDNYLTQQKEYKKLVSTLSEFFADEAPVGSGSKDLFTFLTTPFNVSPDNIFEQLNFIFSEWEVLLSDDFKKKILIGKDLLIEEKTFESAGGGSTPTFAPNYKGDLSGAENLAIGKSGYQYALDSTEDYDEPEQFTEDIGWMPQVVLLAKNVFVWLDQLSKKYQREIKTLDQIPDEELDLLVKWNFTGLWLIGLWQRSDASKRIKHILGNIDAVSSAYSLYDYEIAYELGGEEAYNNLNHRAKERGLRLASDMVPNHTGIYSKWVIEHPEYFVQSPNSPFPNYSFNGEDLSQDPSVEIKIEDGYWSKTDAAVVFRRYDKNNNLTSYVYHGNDGTNMPWNDTAQLDLLKAEVREAVIQKIMDVARRFSIIRFDAAMTLTKKHFSRLWYPQPGKGGDIPSRSDYALTKSKFDELFPKEFWREVVDRINNEMPETLLLAEAFWLMEGYFVRSLGMHRVYNSAFMHMMMKEENAKYRDLITNTLEFEPEILKRYVNFMSNPDEETAIKQFGTDDKFFGVAVLMVTLPGLPMFGHGQIEGYTEKYGMEYQRAYYNETPDAWIVDRHEQEVFPLMNKRYLFSQIKNFWFFDFRDRNGNINENVFAFSNYENDERAIVFYNNRYEETSGTIKFSTPKLMPNKNDGLAIRQIGECLNLRDDENVYYKFKGHISGLEFLRTGRELFEHGFPIELGGFKYEVFWDFFEVYDNTGEYQILRNSIGTNGVHSIDAELNKLKLHPVHDAFMNIFEENQFYNLVQKILNDETIISDEDNHLKFVENKFNIFVHSVAQYLSEEIDADNTVKRFGIALTSLQKLNDILVQEIISEKSKTKLKILSSLRITKESSYYENSIILFIYLILSSLKLILKKNKPEDLISELNLDEKIKSILSRIGKGSAEIGKDLLLIKVLLEHDYEFFAIDDELLQINSKHFELEKTKYISEQLNAFNKNIFEDYNLAKLLNINEYKEIKYYSKENFEDVVNWFFTFSALDFVINYSEGKTDKELFNMISNSFTITDYIIELSEKSKYQLEKLKEELIK